MTEQIKRLENLIFTYPNFTELKHRIDESLKAVWNGETLEETNPQMPDEIAA